MFGSVLPDNAQKALAVLGESNHLKNAYLAGGSALALHFGHRYSIDFDFFSSELFDPMKLRDSLKAIGIFQAELVKGISLIGVFNGVKMSYFQYDYPLIAPTTVYCDVAIAHPYDISAMKLVAITDRGTKKDYIDLYELIKQGIDTETMIDCYEKKYGKWEENRFTIIKSLSYFDEAEETDMPHMIRSVAWEDIKQFLTSESLRLSKKYLSQPST
ncbi:hypothetical protein A3D77_04945 [Candidatus Gottesmanbacteria bacterium RIFCSPHIGHO2_02_FULL_39_11]|uniref:Nucleotidyl transferase AbiEii toxin, Type IV TA system n=1 Tax=Candidatus Gottesmanbacteria bacterium RIFCSPHIGHO2_02_FULL_39_11 TaxID=1798382 RepID=A0A1F5ZM57_9BACT|nr:MAG: hypothetical protein A3D77_04945 [Candidatus Gottesmanbacteria bacterium RIFCSPHIGHO2_02_FULL_39_11]